MAALGIKQESQSRLVLETALGQRLGGLGNIVLIVVVLAPLLSSLLKDFDLGDPLVLLVILILSFVVLRALYSLLQATRVVIDMGTRQATRTSTLLGFPLRQEELSLARVSRVLVGSRIPVAFNQVTSRPTWLVSLQPSDGASLIVNSNGTHDEMLALANKIGTAINRPVADELTRAAGVPSTGAESRPIQDFSGGGIPSYAPPVAAPARLGGRRPASRLPDKTPPPNTLATDSESPEHARFERESQERAPMAPVAPATDMGMPSTNTPSPALDSGMPAMYNPPAPGLDSSIPSVPSSPAPIESGMPSYSPPPPLEMGMPPLYSPPAMALPDQPPLGEPTNAPITIPDGTSTSPTPSAVERSTSPRAPARSWSFDELNKAIAADPNDSLMYYRLGRLWQARGGLGQAMEAYTNALRLDPLNGAMQNDLGLLYFQRRNLKEAESAFRRAGGLDPFASAPHYNLGLLMLRTGRRGEALHEFKRAAQNAANDTEQQRFLNALNGTVGEPMFSPQP